MIIKTAINKNKLEKINHCLRYNITHEGYRCVFGTLCNRHIVQTTEKCLFFDVLVVIEITNKLAAVYGIRWFNYRGNKFLSTLVNKREVRPAVKTLVRSSRYRVKRPS